MSSAPADPGASESPRSIVPRLVFFVVLPLVVLVTAAFGLRAVLTVINGPKPAAATAPAADSLPMPTPMAAPR